MRNEEVKDYTLLAYYLIQKYCSYAKNKDDLKGDMLVVALEAEKKFKEGMGASKTTYLTHCMKTYLFGLKNKKETSKRFNEYYLGKYQPNLEDIKEPILEDVYRNVHMSKSDAIEMFEKILDSDPRRRSIELIMDNSAMLDLNPAKMFECVLDTKMEDMFLHYIEYSLCLSCRPKLVLDTSYITHCRLLAKDEEVKTLQDIGGEYNLTRERIRQLEDRSIKFLKKNFERIFSLDFRRDDDICDWRHPWYALQSGADEDTGRPG